MTANNTQVGGAHYTAPYQHWDLVWDAHMGYFPGQITKYTARWRLKNGLQDLQKALHFAQKYSELLTPALQYEVLADRKIRTYGSTLLLDKFLSASPQLTTAEEHLVITNLTRSHGIEEVTAAIQALESLIAAEPGPAYVSQS